MKCIDRKTGALATRYQLGLLSGEEQERFELHLLKCSACVDEIEKMDPVFHALRRDPAGLLRELNAVDDAPEAAGERNESAFFRLKLAVTDLLDELPSNVLCFVSAHRTAAIVGALGVAAVAVVIWRVSLVDRAGPLPQPQIAVGAPDTMEIHIPETPVRKYASLARIERVEWNPMTLMGAEEESDAELLFENGMNLYTAKKDRQAAALLHRAVKADPENYDARFFLGLSCLLADSAQAALSHLRAAARMARTDAQRERSLWYSANALLLLEDAQGARREMRRVVKMKGDYESEAREILENMKPEDM